MIKWVARLAILTVLLAVVGTILILTRMQKKQDDKEIRKNESDRHLNQLKGDTQEINVRLRPTENSTISGPQEAAEEKKEKTPEKEKILPGEKIGKPPEKKPEEQKVVDQQVGKVPEERLYAEEELRQLIHGINKAKDEHGIYSNCVQILMTRQSNNPRNVSQIETFLRSQQFSIAGRETTSKKVKGIQITPAGECIRITLGN